MFSCLQVKCRQIEKSEISYLASLSKVESQPKVEIQPKPSFTERVKMRRVKEY